MEYRIRLSGVAPKLFPTETFFALLYNGTEQPMELPKEMPFSGDWGRSVSVWEPNTETFPIPCAIDMVWLSITEQSFYSVEKPLPLDKLESLFSGENGSSYDSIIVGMAPYGALALWVSGKSKSHLLVWMKGELTSVYFPDFLPENPNVNLQEYCYFYINNDSRVKENLEKNGLPPRDLFDRYMQQFNYRYVVEFGHWDKEKKEWKEYEGEEVRPEFEYIEEALYDGTHDKLHDGGLMQYHQAGKPKKLALQYHVKKSEYSVYLWFEDFKIRAAFENFYREYPEAEMDFLFRIDPEKNIYQILFTCKEAEQPLPLNEEAYQMIVFKSKFERYRTQNYNQPRGAWIW